MEMNVLHTHLLQNGEQGFCQYKRLSKMNQEKGKQWSMNMVNIIKNIETNKRRSINFCQWGSQVTWIFKYYNYKIYKKES